MSDQPAVTAPDLALDDPIALARAAKIVRAALERQRLRLADLAAPDGGDHAAP